MRVLWLSHLIPYPPKGGVQQRSYNLMREVSRHHEVTLLAFNQPAMLPTPEALADAVRHMGGFLEVEAVFNIPSDVRRGGRAQLALKSLFSRWPYAVNWLRYKPYEAALRRLVACTRFDAVHIDTIGLAPYLDLLPGVPAVLNHHNIESDMMLRRAQLEKNPLKRAYFRQEGLRIRGLEQRYVNRFALNVTCSDLDGERLRALAPGLEYEVIPNGVDLSYFAPRHALGGQTDHTALFAGGLSWYPNAAAMNWFAHKIWPQITQAVPDAKLTVVGRHPPETLQKQAASMGNIVLPGFVDDVRPYMEDASVYVCPIFDGGGTKLKMLDAMAMGKAIVAHPIACEGLGLTDGEEVLIAASETDFAAAVLRLWRDAPLRRQLGEQARHRVEAEYSFVEIGRRLAQAYERISAAAATPRNGTYR